MILYQKRTENPVKKPRGKTYGKTREKTYVKTYGKTREKTYVKTYGKTREKTHVKTYVKTYGIFSRQKKTELHSRRGLIISLIDLRIVI